MPRALQVRLAAVALTAAVCWLWRATPATALWVTYSLGFAHYTLALRYSTTQIRAVSATSVQLLSVAGLGLLSLFLYQIDFSLFVYFGVHHALNETYTRRVPAERLAEAGASLRRAALVFQIVSYLTVLRFSPEFAGVNPLWAWPLFVAAGVHFLRELWRVPSPTARQGLELGAPELTAAALVVLSLFVRITFLQFVLFHFVLWAVLPVERMRATGGAALAAYVVSSIAVTGLFVLLSPIGPPSTCVGAQLFTEQFLFWSFAHITLSFALSNAHPDWLVRLFRDHPARPRLTAEA